MTQQTAVERLSDEQIVEKLKQAPADANVLWCEECGRVAYHVRVRHGKRHRVTDTVLRYGSEDCSRTLRYGLPADAIKALASLRSALVPGKDMEEPTERQITNGSRYLGATVGKDNFRARAIGCWNAMHSDKDQPIPINGAQGRTET